MHWYTDNTLDLPLCNTLINHHHFPCHHHHHHPHHDHFNPICHHHQGYHLHHHHHQPLYALCFLIKAIITFKLIFNNLLARIAPLIRPVPCILLSIWPLLHHHPHFHHDHDDDHHYDLHHDHHHHCTSNLSFSTGADPMHHWLRLISPTLSSPSSCMNVYKQKKKHKYRYKTNTNRSAVKWWSICPLENVSGGNERNKTVGLFLWKIGFFKTMYVNFWSSFCC